MKILPPTIHARISECSEAIWLSGLFFEAQIVLKINHQEHRFLADSIIQEIIVPRLNTGDTLQVKQIVDGEESEFGGVVIVEAAHLPDGATPTIPFGVAICDQCLGVTNVIPGSEVVVKKNDEEIGSAFADFNGVACVPIRADLSNASRLSVSMKFCDQVGSAKAVEVLNRVTTYSEMKVREPLFACQNEILVDNTRVGKRLRLKTTTGDTISGVFVINADQESFSFFRTCWPSVSIMLARPFKPGDTVEVQQFTAGRFCDSEGSWAPRVRAALPQESEILPEIEGALYHGNHSIRVKNQILGANMKFIVCSALNGVSQCEEINNHLVLGVRPAGSNSISDEIDLGFSLVSGSFIAVEQTLCNTTSRSPWVPILARPEQLPAPRLKDPIYDCANAVHVGHLVPGCLIQVYVKNQVGEFLIGEKWNGMSSSVKVELAPQPGAGSVLYAIQRIDDLTSVRSEEIAVRSFKPSDAVPQVVKPVTEDDSEVLVVGVPPGSWVKLLDNGEVFAASLAAESIVRIPVSYLPQSFVVETELCDRTSQSETIHLSLNPTISLNGNAVVENFVFYDRGNRKFTHGDIELEGSDANWDVRYGTYPTSLWVDIPEIDGVGGYSQPLFCRQYYVADNNSFPIGSDLPIVLFMHGQPFSNLFEFSLNGYHYACRHLAGLGYFVISVDVDKVNEKEPSSGPYHHPARCYLINRYLQALQNDEEIAPHLDFNNIGLVGHSMAGEAVTIYSKFEQHYEQDFKIRAAIALAPVGYSSDYVLHDYPYLQIFGSDDRLVSKRFVEADDGLSRGLTLYDNATTDKVHIWIHGADHNNYNYSWVTNTGRNPVPVAGAGLSMHEQQEITKIYITCFLSVYLQQNENYRTYLNTNHFPGSLSNYEIYSQYYNPGRATPIDTADDPDPNTNTMGQAVEFIGPIDITSLIFNHESLNRSLHVGKGLRIKYDTSNSGDIAILRQPLHSAVDDINVLSFISFRIGVDPEDTTLNPVDLEFDLTVALVDSSSGRVVKVTVGSLAKAPYPEPPNYPIMMMRTISIPIIAFQAKDPNFSRFDTVQFEFDVNPTGNVIIDDINLVV